MIETKVATAMYNIAKLHTEIANQYTLLSGIMGEAVETPKSVDVPAAASVPEVASPQVPVIPATESAPVAPTVNTVVPTPTVAPTAPVAPMTESSTPSVAESSPELDDEGYYWDERIHASSKKKVKSKLVKPNGEMWRIKQKCDPVLVEQVRNEQKAAGYGIIGDTPATPAQTAAPIAPTAPTAPTAPQAVAPQAPQAPAAAPVIDCQAIKAVGIEIINKLVNDFKVEYDDILEALREKFKITDYEGLADTQLQDVADYLTGLFNQYDNIHQLELQMRQWGGDQHAESINTSMIGIYSTAHSETLGGVHYSSLPAITEAVVAYHKSWVDAGFSK